jgi:hypothetical protein
MRLAIAAALLGAVVATAEAAPSRFIEDDYAAARAAALARKVPIFVEVWAPW